MTDKTEREHRVTNKKEGGKKEESFPRATECNVTLRMGNGDSMERRRQLTDSGGKERGEESGKARRKMGKDLLQNLQSATSVNLKHKVDQPPSFLSLRLAVSFPRNACGATAHM